MRKGVESGRLNSFQTDKTCLKGTLFYLAKQVEKRVGKRRNQTDRQAGTQTEICMQGRIK